MDTVPDTHDVLYRPSTRIGAAMVGLTLMTGGIGGICVSDYVEEHLSPAIAKDLSDSLNRPVDLGVATSFSPTHIRFGRSIIPATQDDADAVEADAIIIQFSLLDIWNAGDVPLSVTLVRPTIFLDQNDSGDWLQTEMALGSDSKFPIKTVRLRDADVSLKPFYAGFQAHPKAINYVSEAFDREQATAEPAIAPDVSVQEQLDEQFAVSDEVVRFQGLRASVKRNHNHQNNDVLTFDVRTRGAESGNVRVGGQVNLDEGRAEATIQAHRLAIAPLTTLLPSSVLVKDGVITGQMTMMGGKEEPVALRGSAMLKQVTAWVDDEPNPVKDAQARLVFEEQTIRVEDGTMTYGWIPFEVGGTVHLEDGVNLQAQADGVDANDFMATFDLNVPVPVTGDFKTDNLTVTGKFGQTVFAGTVTNVESMALDQVIFDAVQTDFTLDKGSDILTLTQTTLTPAVGGQIVGNAHIRLGEADDAVITARADGLSADAIAQLYGLSLADTQLGQISANTQVVLTGDGVQTQLSWGLTEGDYQAAGLFSAVDDHVSMRDTTIQIGQELVTATGELADGRWQTTLQTDGVSLASAIPDAEGQLEGHVTVSGALDDLRLAAIHGTGEVSVAAIHPMLTEPLQVDFDWQGDRLHIRRAASSWLEADGWMTVAFSEARPSITDMALNVRVQEMDLAAVSAELPMAVPVSVAGQSQFAGVITGTPDRPALDGQLQLTDFAVGAIAFESDLQGSVTVSADQAMQVALAGEQDNIRIVGNGTSVDFDLQREDAVAQGQVKGHQLAATLQDIPLTVFHEFSALNLDENSFLTALTGELSGRVAMDWQQAHNPTMLADVAIANPMLGTLPPYLRERHQGDRLTGMLRYRDGAAHVTDGQLHFGESRLRLAGHAAADDVSGRIDIEHGALQDVMTLVQAISRDTTMSSTVMALINQEDSSVPSSLDMASLMEGQPQVQGTLRGSIGVQFNPQRDAIHASVGLRGDQWQIGRLGVDQFHLENGRLSKTAMAVADLQLIGISYGDMSAPEMTLSASIDSSRQTGQLQIGQVPLSLISQWVDSPVQVGGEFGAIAHWQQTGTLPNMTGSFSLDNLRMGRFDTEAIQVGFNVENDVLQLGRWLIPGNPVELVATGRIPFRLPYMAGVPNAPVRFVSHEETMAVQAVRRESPQEFGVDGADKIVVSLGLLQQSFGVAELEQLIATGDVPNGWGIYLDLANLDAAALQSALTQEVALDLVMTDHLLNSPLGEQVLEFVGRVVHTPSGHANVQALRSALVFSVHDDGRVSLLEFFKNYPHDEIHVNLDELTEVMKVLEQSQD